MAAIDFWFNHVICGDSAVGVTELLCTEVPPILSWVTRGGCGVQCQHCIFPVEGPEAFEVNVGAARLIEFLEEMPDGVSLVHEGRQLLPWQIPVLASVAQAGYPVSIINNGQYASPETLACIAERGLVVDVLDVSVDGPPAVHNKQRSSTKAWMWAERGLQNARSIIKPSGKLTSLFTLTALNSGVVRDTGGYVVPLVDEWHLTTMSLRHGIEHLRAPKHDLANALEQLLGKTWEKPVFIRIYSLDDFAWLLEILGPETARAALRKAQVSYNALVLDIGLPVYFYPKSLQINEALVVDADGWWRTPFCIHHTVGELQQGRDSEGNDISHYSVADTRTSPDVSSTFAQAVDVWWKAIGLRCLEQERSVLQSFV